MALAYKPRVGGEGSMNLCKVGITDRDGWYKEFTLERI